MSHPFPRNVAGVPQVAGFGALAWISEGIAARWKNPEMTRILNVCLYIPMEGCLTDTDAIIEPHHCEHPTFQYVKLGAIRRNAGINDSAA